MTSANVSTGSVSFTATVTVRPCSVYEYASPGSRPSGGSSCTVMPPGAVADAVVLGGDRERDLRLARRELHRLGEHEAACEVDERCRLGDLERHRQSQVGIGPGQGEDDVVALEDLLDIGSHGNIGRVVVVESDRDRLELKGDMLVQTTKER